MSAALGNTVEEWQRRAVNARNEAHRLLAKHANATNSRVILLEDLLQQLNPLPIDVQDYFREAATCLQHELTRAAIVLSWSGFFHTVSSVLYQKHEALLRTQRPKWGFASIEELRETQSESAILEAAKAVSLINKNDLKQMQGQLSRRNQCAHPTLYRPSMNVALAFVDEMIEQTIKFL